MRRTNTNILFAAFAAIVLMIGCDLLKDVTYSVNPSPLEAHGDSVKVSITANVPEKGIKKTAIADLTPVIRWNGGEKQLKSITIQGEKAAGNGVVINSKTGGSFTYTDVVAYEEGMMDSELFVTGMAGKGDKREAIDEFKIADGVIATAYLVQDDDMPIMAEDKFQRIIEQQSSATINYLVNSPTVRSSELRDEDIKAMNDLMKDIAADERKQAKALGIDAYASPEGEVDKNNALADRRAGSAKSSSKNMARRAKLEDLDESYNEKGLGEDWNGFRTLMQQSDIEDKELIIRILETYSDVNEREKEIKNLSKTYTEIADQILPKLRRSEIMLTYDLIGYSDEELIDISLSNPDSLNLEELLYAANLHSDMNDQLKVYQNAEARFTDDYRAANNIGGIYMMQGNLEGARSQFEKAYRLEENAITSNNMGIFKRRDGDRKAAAEHFRTGMSAGDKASYNLGIVNIQDGDYASAVSNMQGYSTVNAALAALLNGDNSSAMSILDSAQDGDTGVAHYLRAVAAARSGEASAVAGHLQTAISKDASLKDRAMKDKEFIGMTLGL